MARSDASAAPATPSGRPVTQPKMRVGARIMLKTTVTIWITVGIFTSPMPRRAAPMATSTNWRNSAGTNQVRYCTLSEAVAASAASQRL